MSFSAMKYKVPPALTAEQLEKILQSNRNIQEAIDSVNRLRKSNISGEINYFERFLIQAHKYI